MRGSLQMHFGLDLPLGEKFHSLFRCTHPKILSKRCSNESTWIWHLFRVNSSINGNLNFSGNYVEISFPLNLQFSGIISLVNSWKVHVPPTFRKSTLVENRIPQNFRSDLKFKNLLKFHFDFNFLPSGNKIPPNCRSDIFHWNCIFY